MQDFDGLGNASRKGIRCSQRFTSISCLLLCIGLLTWCGGAAVQGQTGTAKKKPAEKTTEKPAKKTKAGMAAEESPQNQLEELEFATTLPQDGSAVDLDETAEGKARLEALQERAREIFKERDKVDRQRRPLVIPRDRLLGEIGLLNQGIAKAQQVIRSAETQIRNLSRTASASDNGQAARDQIQSQTEQIRLANQAILYNQEEISERTPEVEALNLQIIPLEERLVKLWLELNSARKQWLEVRQPQLKYGYGQFESLKRVIDDWLLLDGLWPDAYVWAALSNYELGEYQVAWEHVEKAAELRKTLQFPKAWPQGEALRGLIAGQIRERRAKAAGHLQAAGVFVAKDRKTSWETFFVIGRASFDNEKLAAKAKANFEKALKTRPDAACVQFWNGRLQTTSTVPAVRDVEQGTKTLETLWQRSSKKSWRLSHALVLAYDAYDQEAKSKEFWDLTQQLAPETEHQRLLDARQAALEKLKAMTAAAENPKPKKTKTSSKPAD